MVRWNSVEHATDADLIRFYQQGDETALAFLIQRYLASTYRFLARMLNDRVTAEDLVQETYLKAWKGLSRFDPSKPFKPWLFSIARNAAIDYIRKKQALPFSSLEEEGSASFDDTISDQRPLPPTVLQQKDLGEQLTRALTSLSPTARSIVLMHETEDLTFQEIAEILHEPLNTVKSRYRRALLILRTKITSDGEMKNQPNPAPN